MRVRRSSRALGWCAACRKLLYPSRKAARKVAREHRDHKNEYPCPVNSAMFHVGGLPESVIRGEVTRGEYYRQSA